MTQKSGKTVLVVGSGGREHALAWKLEQSTEVARVLVAPGNGGIRLANRRAVKVTDIEGMLKLAKDEGVDLTVVGPEAPLVAGIVDRFVAEGLRIFGPTAAAAKIEGSKVFAKNLMQRAGVPTAYYIVADTMEDALACIQTFYHLPVVIKADGLCAGKGVFVVKNMAEATAVLHRIFIDREFGDKSSQVVVEDHLAGWEVSVFILTDGVGARWFGDACDYKRLFADDKGPNTGGMGSFSPSPLTDEDRTVIMRKIVRPTLESLASLGTPYRGLLYVGLMMTAAGPKVLEFNCRFGDPETQAVLPLVKDDLFGLLWAAAEKHGLANLGAVHWKNEHAVCVVMTSEGYGYSGKIKTGVPIEGNIDERDLLPSCSAFVFHAGTEIDKGRLVTNGGRVLNVVGRGITRANARLSAYGKILGIDFPGAQYRRDIAV